MTRAWLLLLGALATVGFAATVLVIIPRVMLVRLTPPRELRPYSAVELRGRTVYIANGCVYCHSQQVRDPDFTTDVERGWGSRATVPADYVYDRPHLLGTMRTGPDLSNVGLRLPDTSWQLMHLYSPRAVAPWSIMPAFPFLFDVKDSSALRPADRPVPVASAHVPRGKVVVATPDALALVSYLLSLKHEYPVPAAAASERRAGAAGRSLHTMP